jgi:KTSC domain
VPSMPGVPTPPDPREVLRRARLALAWVQAGREALNYEPKRYGLTSDPRWARYGLQSDDIHEVNALTGSTGHQAELGKNTAFNDLITAGEFQAISYEDWLPPTTPVDFYANQSSKFLDPSGYNYEYDWTRGGQSRDALAQAQLLLMSTTSKDAAEITYVPTSTTNPERPRTIAAGWDGLRKVLTTVFRDGTYYNYYEVDSGTWNNFVRARSKGVFIYTYLDGHIRGHAEVSDVPMEHREILARLARTAQVVRGGVTGRQVAHSRRGGRGSYGKQGSSQSGGRMYARAKAATIGAKAQSAQSAVAQRRAAQARGVTQSQYNQQP